MKKILVIASGLISLFTAGNLAFAQIDKDAEVARIVAQSQEALAAGDEKNALALVKAALERFPENEELRVQTAAIYADQNQDQAAIDILRALIRDNPSSRAAKLKLAQIHGYRGEYAESDRLYRELLTANPADETASLGLAHNLILEGNKAEAQIQVHQALRVHPASLLLQEYNDSLDKSISPGPGRSAKWGRVQAAESIFADSSGNHAVDSFQSVFYQFTPNLFSRLRFNESNLWRTGTPSVTVVAFDDEIRLRINRFFALHASGGVVRFADTSSKGIGSADLELFPLRNLNVSGGYSRYGVYPTFDATLFDLVSEGWHGRLSYIAKNFTVNGTLYSVHYSDGNRAEKEWGEAMRWFRLGETTSVGAGYAFRHLHFSQELDHGYFSPSQYWSQLGAAGFRMRVGRYYRGEILGYAGGETQDAAPYTVAGEAAFRNEFTFKRWDVEAGYSYYHLAQTTGAFHANAGTVGLSYRF